MFGDTLVSAILQLWISPCETSLESGSDVKCDENGDYFPIQCNAEAGASKCWCVDIQTGVEKVGTQFFVSESNPDYGSNCRPKFEQVMGVRPILNKKKHQKYNLYNTRPFIYTMF